MTFLEANVCYENWLRKHCDVVEKAIHEKHERMAKEPFMFLRCTYFRWAKRIGKIASEVADAPTVMAVGDAHLENFGTWRDAEGRLVWGVNDFDDAAEMPYVFDLIRLASSARLRKAEGKLKGKEAAAAILHGYQKGLEEPKPMLLDEEGVWFRSFITPTDAERRKFWGDLNKLDTIDPPEHVKQGFQRKLLQGAVNTKYYERTKGGGSLGRPRYVAIGEWRGGRAVREAKAVVPSGWHFAHESAAEASQFLTVAEGLYRSPDPFLSMHGGFVFRRISADARKLDLEDNLPPQIEPLLLQAMGYDLASIHATNEKTRKHIREDLKNRKDGWLHKYAKDAAEDVKSDYVEWKTHWDAQQPKAKN